MIKDYNYIELTCDICGKSEQFKNPDDIIGFFDVAYPVLDGENIKTAKKQLCRDCVRLFEKNMKLSFDNMIAKIMTQNKE